MTQQSLSQFEEHLQDILQYRVEKELLIIKNYPRIIADYDRDLIIELMESLLNNVYCFAEKTITITITLQEKLLIIYVKDDGPGFSKKELLTATEPYYFQNKNSHFGLGLTIVEALTQKHVGNLKIVNSIDGGAIISAVFAIKVENLH